MAEIVFGVTGVVTGAFSLSLQLFNLSRRFKDTPSNFNTFASELNSLSSLWDAILPYLQDNQSCVAPRLADELHRISNDTRAILEEAQEWVNRLEVAARNDVKNKGKREYASKLASFRVPVSEFKRLWKQWSKVGELENRRRQLDYSRAHLQLALNMIRYVPSELIALILVCRFC